MKLDKTTVDSPYKVGEKVRLKRVSKYKITVQNHTQHRPNILVQSEIALQKKQNTKNRSK